MFRLEKVLQNDDSAYIIFTQLIKSGGIFLSFYIFSILENNSIYDLSNSKIFFSSKYYIFSTLLSILYLFISLFFLKNRIYKYNFISYLRDDLAIIVGSNILIFTIFFFKGQFFVIDKSYFYSLIFLAINLFIGKKIFNGLYTYMANNDVIHKNIIAFTTFSFF